MTCYRYNNNNNNKLIANNLIFARVLYNLCAQVAGFDGAQILLVALPVAGVLVEHVRRPSLCLRLNDSVPQLLSLHHTLSPAFLLIPGDKRDSSDTLAQRNEPFVNNRDWWADPTGYTALQTSLPSTLPTLDIHWGTSETSPVGAAVTI